MSWKLYVIHFDRPYKHAKHYTGIAIDVEKRMKCYFISDFHNINHISIKELWKATYRVQRIMKKFNDRYGWNYVHKKGK